MLAVEQWPECLNPVTSCVNATWTLWSTLVHVLPRLMELDTNNTYVASSLLTVEPNIDNGGLVTADDGTFTLTYQLNPEAPWSDGTLITSSDVWFTWRAALDTTGTLSTPGYDLITGDLTFAVGAGTFIEGLWINQDAPDRRFDVTRNVRQALAYALDRERIADVALGSIVPDPEVLQCTGWNPGFGERCNDDFARYLPDAAKVAELLEAEGWTRPDPDGLWVNPEGEELVLA